MLSVNLGKPEATFDQVRKQYKNLQPTDAALIATALVGSVRFAIAVRDGVEMNYPDDREKLVKSYLREVEIIKETSETVEEKPVKKTTKTAKAVEPESITIGVDLKANAGQGDQVLGDREDLKTLLSDIIEEGVEVHYGPADILWHWLLERVNWATISDGELDRHIKFQPSFIDNSNAIEIGTGTKRRRRKSS